MDNLYIISISSLNIQNYQRMPLSIKKLILPSSAFLAGFSLMVMELTASRVLAPIVGSSLYTWTSVIGIIMLGLAIGNFIGGYYIDKNSSRKTAGIFYFLAVAGVLIVSPAASFSKELVLLDLPLIFIILLITFLIFFLPSLFIGCIYPCIFKFYVKELSETGKSSGRLSALWTLGSIAGTFLTGFVFISYFGSKNTLWTIALLLLINGLFFYIPSKKGIFWAVIFFSALINFVHQKIDAPSGSKIIFEDESAYYAIKVVDANKFPYGQSRFMFLDFDNHGVEGSGIAKINIYTNAYPIFSTMKDSIKDILVLGGGPETIAKNFSSYYRYSRVTNVEIDPQVSRVAEKFFDTGSFGIEEKNADGRIFLRKNNAKYDLIFNDAYNSFISVPWHLSTEEFNDLARSRLNEGGIYAVNFISAREGEGSIFFQSMLKTFKATFPNNYVFSFNNNPKKVQNIVLVGLNSEKHPEESELKKQLFSLPGGSFLSQDLIANAGHIEIEADAPFLKDDYAPTEKLMAPIIKSYFAVFASFYHSLI